MPTATVLTYRDYYAWCEKCGWASDHTQTRAYARRLANRHRCPDLTAPNA